MHIVLISWAVKCVWRQTRVFPTQFYKRAVIPLTGLVLFTTTLPIRAEPSLAETQAAAEKGDARAEDALADFYRTRLDMAKAELWYRKAAEQGIAHSQTELAHILMSRARQPDATTELRVTSGDEAIHWLVKAASRGEKRAQLDLGNHFQEGRFIKQDNVKAWKWFTIARGGNPLDPLSIQGKNSRDAMTLKITGEQIKEANKRAAAFVPHTATKTDLPEPIWMKEIRLQGISGTGARRWIIINNQTLQKGEEAKVKVTGKSVNVRCLEVRASSAIISVEGYEGQRELKFK